jgi:hypothetical protein
MLLHQYLKGLRNDPLLTLDEEIVKICDILQSQDDLRKIIQHIEVEPNRNKNILLVIECKGLYEGTFGYLCFERDLVPGFYNASYWVGDEESKATEIRQWNIKDISANEVIRNFVRILKCF